MTKYKSFKTSKNKIQTIWKETEDNLNDSIDLQRQNIISSQKNFNKILTKISLIKKREIIHIFNDDSIGLLALAHIEEFVISNIPESFLPFSRIVQKFYRNPLAETEIATIDFLKIEYNDMDKIYWKIIDDNTILLQIDFPFISFSNQTFMDVDLIITNPNNFAPLPKFKL